MEEIYADAEQDIYIRAYLYARYKIGAELQREVGNEVTAQKVPEAADPADPGGEAGTTGDAEPQDTGAQDVWSPEEELAAYESAEE